jgi:hypothetical protein
VVSWYSIPEQCVLFPLLLVVDGSWERFRVRDEHFGGLTGACCSPHAPVTVPTTFRHTMNTLMVWNAGTGLCCVTTHCTFYYWPSRYDDWYSDLLGLTVMFPRRERHRTDVSGFQLLDVIYCSTVTLSTTTRTFLRRVPDVAIRSTPVT